MYESKPTANAPLLLPTTNFLSLSDVDSLRRQAMLFSNILDYAMAKFIESLPTKTDKILVLTVDAMNAVGTTLKQFIYVFIALNMS